MNADTVVVAVPALAALIVFVFVWGKLAFDPWEGISASGAVLGWMPAALAAAIAAPVAFGIVTAAYLALAALGVAGL